MTLEEFKKTIKSLDDEDVCKILSGSNCEQCFCQTKDKECIITIFSEGILDEIGNK